MTSMLNKFRVEISIWGNFRILHAIRLRLNNLFARYQATGHFELFFALSYFFWASGSFGAGGIMSSEQLTHERNYYFKNTEAHSWPYGDVALSFVAVE